MQKPFKMTYYKRPYPTRFYYIFMKGVEMATQFRYCFKDRIASDEIFQKALGYLYNPDMYYFRKNQPRVMTFPLVRVGKANWIQPRVKTTNPKDETHSLWKPSLPSDIH